MPLLLLLAGCAMNLSEVRPARVLGGGEWEVTQVSNVVAPLDVLRESIEPAGALAEAWQEGRELTDEESRVVATGAVAVALEGPGYGTHVDAAVGLGYGFDVQARVGNGIYAAALRRRLVRGRQPTLVGVRLAWNTGDSFVPYLGLANGVVDVASLRRVDGQLFLETGRERGEWAAWWAGAKLMASSFAGTVDGGALGLGEDAFAGTLWHAGIFGGGAIGFRYVFAVGELGIHRAWGGTEVFGVPLDLAGLVLAPSWGVRVVF